jgi:hypothetical protein
MVKQVPFILKNISRSTKYNTESVFNGNATGSYLELFSNYTLLKAIKL